MLIGIVIGKLNAEGYNGQDETRYFLNSKKYALDLE